MHVEGANLRLMYSRVLKLKCVCVCLEMLQLSVLENGSMNFVSMNPGIAECFRAGCSSTSN